MDWKQAINPSVIRCTSCKNELKLHLPWGWPRIIEWTLWLIFMYILTHNMVGAWPFVVPLMMAVPWVIARDRLYHSYWLWRHPRRCGGGHPFTKAVPDSS